MININIILMLNMIIYVDRRLHNKMRAELSVLGPSGPGRVVPGREVIGAELAGSLSMVDFRI